MAKSMMTRRQAVCIAGAILTAGCSSGEDPPLTADAKGNPVKINIASLWERTDAWLASHAPKILTNLNPPATEKEIHEAEKAFGLEMPNDWRELYRAHNGMNSDSNLGSLFYGMEFIALSRAVQEHKNNAAAAEHMQPVRAGNAAIRKDDIYNPKWIAIAHDGGDTLLRVDLVPATAGETGQVIFTDHAENTAILLHRSVAELMSEFVRDLEAGRYFLNQDAIAEGDQFLDCDPQMDVVNWAHSPRWKHLAR